MTVYCCTMALRIVINVSKLNYGSLVRNYLLKEPHSFGESRRRFEAIHILHTSATSVRNVNFKADHYVPLIKKEKVIVLTGCRQIPLCKSDDGVESIQVG